MKNHGTVRSTIRPEAMIIDDYSVWIAKNITELNENAGEENEFIGFEYECIQYDKNDYIRDLNTDLTDTQLALVELYEGMVL